MEPDPKPHRRPRIAKNLNPTPHWVIMLLRHPLMVLFAGTIISSIGIPWLNTRSAQARQVEESRQTKALEILKDSTNDNARLNSIGSAFGMFEKEGALTGSTELIEERRSELRKRVYEGYEAFEQSAWWWYWGIGREAELFGWLSPAEIAAYRQLAKQYQDNLYESSKLIQIPWRSYLAEVKESPTEKKQPLMPTIETSLGKKQAERDELAARMVRMFIK